MKIHTWYTTHIELQTAEVFFFDCSVLKRTLYKELFMFSSVAQLPLVGFCWRLSLVTIRQ